MITNRHYVASGRYGYGCVDEYQEHDGEDTNHAVYSSVCMNTQKLAREIAGRLNFAYRAGWSDATENMNAPDRTNTHASVEAIDAAMTAGEHLRDATRDQSTDRRHPPIGRDRYASPVGGAALAFRDAPEILAEANRERAEYDAQVNGDDATDTDVRPDAWKATPDSYMRTAYGEDK